VTAAAAVARAVTEFDEFTGRLQAVQSVAVRPRVSGLISNVTFTEGSLVHQGQLLFQVDDRPFRAEVDRLRAELVQATAARDRAQSEMKRADRLSVDNAISAEERERRADAAAESTAHADAVAAALRAAQLDLEFTRVVSPIDGRVSRALVTRGNLVSGGQGEATLLTTVVSVDPIYASFDADEQTFLRYGDRARQQSSPGRAGGLPIQMALADEKTFKHDGTLQFMDNQLDPATGTTVRPCFITRTVA
jgi:multidrug efflux system membrane fusion protein